MADNRTLRDGQVSLRLDIDTSPYWQYRIALPGYENKQSRKSTKLTNFEEAKRYAFKEHDRLLLRHEEGLPVLEKAFSQVSKQYLKRKKREVQSRRFSERNYQTISNFLTNQAEPYFSNKKIASIRKKDIDRFLEHIEDNSARGVSWQTLNKYRTYLRQVFKFARDQEYLTEAQIPPIKNEGRRGKNKEDMRRPAFTPQQVELIRELGKDWAQAGQRTIKSKQNRWLLYNYALFIVHSGLRPGLEVETLKFGNVSGVSIKDGNVIDQIVYRIAVQTGKTGPRITFTDSIGYFYIESMQKGRFDGVKIGKLKAAIRDHFIFRRPDGEISDNIEKQFARMLEALDKKRKPDEPSLVKDPLGRPYTLYSLRHFYATQKAAEAEVPLASLAKYMGTSMFMFEQHYIQMNPDTFKDEVASTGLSVTWEKEAKKKAKKEKEVEKEAKEKKIDSKLDAILEMQSATLETLLKRYDGPVMIDDKGQVIELVQSEDGSFVPKDNS